MLNAATAPATATGIRLRPAPACEPPYDDERTDSHTYMASGTTPLLTHPLLPCFTVQPYLPTTSNTWQLSRPRPARVELGSFGRRNTPSCDLPEPGPHGRRLAQALLEMIAGVRPLGQLVPWLHESLYFELAERYSKIRTANRQLEAAGTQHLGRYPAPQPRVTRVHTCQPADGVAEISAVASEQGRAYAVALRLEGLDGGWRCTSFTVV